MSEQEVDWKQFGESMTTWANNVGKALELAFQQIIPVAQGIADAVWAGYRAAGMPYGDSHEGLMKWMQDMGEIKRHEQEIERIKQRHEMLIHARALGEQIRAKRAEQE